MLEARHHFVAYGFVALAPFRRGHAPFVWRRLSRPCLTHGQASCARSVLSSRSYGASRAGLEYGLCNRRSLQWFSDGGVHHGSDEQSVHKAQEIRHRYRHNDKRDVGVHRDSEGGHALYSASSNSSIKRARGIPKARMRQWPLTELPLGRPAALR